MMDRQFRPFTCLSDNELTTTDFLAWIGSHADGGTRHILLTTLVRCCECDVVSVVASLQRAEPRNRAAWVIGALNNARAERLEANR